MTRGAGTYLVTRTHGLRTHLITPRDMLILAKAKSPKDFSESLLKTDYADQIGQLPTDARDPVTLENLILRRLVERFFFLRRAAQGKMQDLLARYCSRFEVENVKRIFRAKHGGGSEKPNLIPLQREESLVNFPALLKAKDVDEVASLLRDTPFHTVQESLQAYKETGTSMILEASLDKIYYSRVWDLGREIGGVRNLIGGEIDLRNLLSIFSLKAREVSPRVIETSVLPFSPGLPKDTMRSLLQGRFEDAPNILSGGYSKLASEAVNLLRSRSLLRLEWLFLNHLYGDASAALRTQGLQAGYIIAYLLLCECEAKNLVTIVIGKRLNLGEEEISKGLLGVSG